MPQGHPGAPPEMPPHGSSDPDSPNYNPDRAAWEDRVGKEEAQRIKTAWQEWAGKEGDYIKQQLGSGLNLDEVPTENAGETYRDAPEHGASQFAYWRTPEGQAELRFLRQQGLEYSKRGGHATWDPRANAYLGERRNGVEIMRDQQGNIIRDASGNFLNAAAFDWGRNPALGTTNAPPTANANPNPNPNGVYANSIRSYGQPPTPQYGHDVTSGQGGGNSYVGLGMLDLANNSQNTRSQSQSPWAWI